MGNESTETTKKGAETECCSTSSQNNNSKQQQKLNNNSTLISPTIVTQDVDFKQILVPTLKSTHEQMRNCITIDLLTACQREINFLRMIDRKAPVLYDRIVVSNAIRRYECYWLPAQASKPDLLNIPPLDVHWVWHVHMLSPVSYREDCLAICGTVVDHKLLSADEIQQRYEQSVSAWNEFCPEEPYEFLLSSSKPYKQKSKYDIIEAVQRQRNFNYQISLPHYTSPRFLNDAIDRYINFLQLKQTYFDQFLTPCYDFDLVWHTHQVHPEDYFRNCVAIFGSLLKHDDSVNDRNKGSKLLRGEAFTKKAWNSHFKNNFWRRGCMFRGHNAPAFLCLESDEESSNNASNLAYGNIHIPSIVLKELPVQREQLRLKLRYGGKKISTFSAQLWDKQVTRPSFSLIWQPNPSGLKCIQHNKNDKKQTNGYSKNSKNSTGSASSTSTSSSTSSTSSNNNNNNNQPTTSLNNNYLSTIISSSTQSSSQQIPSIVKFPFERKTAKEFVVELELFDKVFLHKRDLVKLKGRLPLDKLLPLQISSTNVNTKSSQNVVQLQLENLNGEHAKINITTSVSLNRELELQAGEYREQQLTTEDARLWSLCQAAALNRSQLQPGAKIYVAIHNLVDVRDGTKYFVQVVHSAPLLLSMILVFGTEQRLLCMAHLIGADSLPSKQQLDENLQFLPNISHPAADERAFIILNRDGDFAILKGRWQGFVRKQIGDRYHKGISGAPGALNVELFNLLRNTVQNFQLPAANGSTVFSIGDAQAQLNGRRMHCRSTQTAEHLACIFGIGTLFILCNPDKVRSVKEAPSKVGHQCQRWPMTVACGYGRPLPSNRLISAAQRHHHDFGGTEFLPLLLMNMCSGAEGGSGGGCDGGGDGGGGACGIIF